MKKILFVVTFLYSALLFSQNVMTPEKLWELGRVSALGISEDRKNVVYQVTTPAVITNDFSTKYYSIPVKGGAASEVEDYTALLKDSKISPDGKYKLYHEKVKVNKVHGKDFYPEMEDSNAQIYDD